MALHKGVKNIHCDECDQSFYTTSALLSHKMRQHDDQAEVICPECGKTCSNKYTLKRHMIRHTGERQFKCEWEGCGKSFYDSQVLKVHEKLHLDLKEFQCSLCPKQFRQSQHLVVHMKPHQGVVQPLLPPTSWVVATASCLPSQMMNKRLSTICIRSQSVSRNASRWPCPCKRGFR